MKVLFATTNPAKIKYYAERLKERNVEVLTLKDIDLNIDVEETGNNAVENAMIKSRAYFDASGIVTISLDDSLFIEGLSEEKQPGTNVRRVNGKRLDDEEMIQYYSGLVKEMGGKVSAKWVKGIAIYDGVEMKTFEYARSSFFFVDTPSKVINVGYPIDSLAIIPMFNKYLSELTKEEMDEYSSQSSYKEVFEFVVNNIKEV